MSSCSTCHDLSLPNHVLLYVYDIDLGFDWKTLFNRIRVMNSLECQSWNEMQNQFILRYTITLIV